MSCVTKVRLSDSFRLIGTLTVGMLKLLWPSPVPEKAVLQRWFPLIVFQTYANMRLEALKGYLGILWLVLEPLLYLGVLYVVFGHFLRSGGEQFVGFLLCGVIPYRWFDNTIRTGSGSIASNIPLLQQTYIPKFVMPCVSVSVAAIKFLVPLSLWLLFLLALGVEPNKTWVSLPIVIAIQFLFQAALSGILALLVPFYPDMRILINNGLLFLMFLSGVFFNPWNLAHSIRYVVLFNPLALLIDSYRATLLRDQWPDFLGLAVVALVSMVVGRWAMYGLQRYDRIIPKAVRD